MQSPSNSLQRLLVRSHRPSGAGARGFTLVELMVAITGGLFLSIVVFSLSRQGTQFYQQEMRVAAATNDVIVGFERLRTDISRAGFMSSPNVRRDATGVCGDPIGDVSWPAGLRQLASITVEPNATPMPAPIAAQVSPSQITISGALSSVEAFPTGPINDDGVNYLVSLDPNSPPMVRIGYNIGLPAASQVAVLSSIFAAGRAVRIVTKDSHQALYGTIIGVDASSGTERPDIRLSHNPAMAFTGVNSKFCGIKGFGEGSLVNVVNTVRYDVRNLSSDANYASVYAASATGPYDSTRTELTRVELDTAGAVIPGTQELVAEYAVDLQFGVTVVDSILGGTDPTLLTLAPGDPAVAQWVGPTPGLAANRGPELVRAVRVRLSIRSRDADRPAGVTASSTVAPGLYRIGLGNGGGAPFARVRTLQSDIGLRNQTGVYW